MDLTTLVSLISLLIALQLSATTCCSQLPAGSTCVCKSIEQQDNLDDEAAKETTSSPKGLMLDCVKITYSELVNVLEDFPDDPVVGPNTITVLYLRHGSDLSGASDVPPNQLVHVNKLVVFESRIPLDILRSWAAHLQFLRRLYLDKCEGLTEIPPKAFSGFQSLQELHIYNNPGLKFVHDHAFDDLHDSLNTLVFKENNMTSIPKAVTSLVALEKLDLYGNEIKTVPDEMVEFLDDMKNLNNLVMNKLNCTCEFGEGDFVAWVQRLAIKGSLCATPSKLLEMDVSTIPKDGFCNSANSNQFVLSTFFVTLLSMYLVNKSNHSQIV